MSNCCLSSFSVLFPSLAFAQSYGQLWKSVGDAQAKDLPQTEISALDKIVAKASREGNYGQLLAAGMRRSSCRVTVSPDSLQAEIQRLSSAAAATSSPSCAQSITPSSAISTAPTTVLVPTANAFSATIGLRPWPIPMPLPPSRPEPTSRW